jgi:CRP-like cAMP-binding protein
MDRKTELVASVPLFAKLEPRSLDAVATLAKVVPAKAGRILVREGEPATSFFIVVDGTVHIERAGRFVNSITDGGFFGEIGLIEDRERTATATCATDCQLLEFDTYAFSRVLATFPDVQARVQAAAARRPHQADA